MSFAKGTDLSVWSLKYIETGSELLPCDRTRLPADCQGQRCTEVLGNRGVGETQHPSSLLSAPLGQCSCHTFCICFLGQGYPAHLSRGLPLNCLASSPLEVVGSLRTAQLPCCPQPPVDSILDGAKGTSAE